MKALKKLVSSYWPFAAFALIILYVSRGFLFKPGYILFGEFISSSDFIFFLKDALKSWSDYTLLGHSQIGFPSTYGLYPAYMITPQRGFQWFALLSFFQVIAGASWASKLYTILALFSPFLGMYFFALFWFKKYKQKRLLYQTLAFISGIIYAINATVGDRIFAGHTVYPLGYGLLPLYLFFYCKFIEEKENNKKALLILGAGVTFSLLLWVMPHLLIFALFSLGFYFLLFVLEDKKKVKAFFIGGLISTVIGFLLNINLWFPAIFYPEFYPFISNSEYILLYPYNMAHYVTFEKVITLTSGAEAVILSSSQIQNLFTYRMILPLLSFVFLIFTKDRKRNLFISVIIISGIVFGMGVNHPFERLYGFLFEHVLLFEPFRDTSKFLVLFTFGLSLILPTLFIYIYKFFRRWILFAVFLFVVFLLYINPMFTSGNFAGNIQPFIYPHKYDVLKEYFAEDKDYYRVAIYPNDKNIGSYNWFPKTPNGSIHPTIFSSLVPLDKGLAVSNRTIGNFPSRYLDHIEANLDKEWAVKRLGDDRVKYLILDPDMDGYQKYLNALQKNSAVSETKLVQGFTSFKIKNFSEQTIHKHNSIYYFGDMKGMQFLPSDLALINLVYNSTDILSRNLSDFVVLYRSSLNDVFLNSLVKFRFSFFPEIRFVSNGTDYLTIAGENLRGLSIDGVSLYSPEAMLTGGPGSIEKKSNFSAGKYRVFLNVLNYPNFTDSVAIKIGDKLLVKKHFQGDKDTLIWVDFGEVEVNKNNSVVKLQNLREKYIIVDSLLIVPEKEYVEQLKKFDKLMQNKMVITLNEQADFSSLAINEKRIDVLAQSYSPYWDVCGSRTFLVNFYATGAKCPENVFVNPTFKPALLYKLSITLTGIFYMLIFGFISKLIFSKKKVS